MNSLIGYLLLGLLLIVTFVASTTSTSVRTRAVPLAIGACSGLFGVEISKVHLITPIIVGWYLARLGRQETRLGRAAIALPLVCAPLALTVLFGDLVVNPNLALQLMALSIGGAFIVMGWSDEIRRPLLLGLLSSTTASSVIGVMQVAHVIPANLFNIAISGLGRPTGFYPEPDWLGMYSAVGALIAWRIPLPPRIRSVLVLFNLSTLVLAFARAAWLGFGIAVVVAAICWLATGNRGAGFIGTGKTGRLRALLATVVALFVALSLLPNLRNDLLLRLGDTLSAHSGDVSAQARVEQNQTLNAMADTAPWYGHGLSASGRVGVSGIYYTGESPNSVASNWLLGLWVDCAWLSVPLLALLLVVILKSVRNIEGSVILIVLISSFFSNAFFQPILWTMLALALARTSPGPAREQQSRLRVSVPDRAAQTMAIANGQRGKRQR